MISRRRFLQSSLTVALVPFLPRFAFAQTTPPTLLTRPSWPTFCGSPLYQVYVDTLRKMRANKNIADPNSWNYWATAHMNYGLHKVPYFLAWHRGFLSQLEAQMRIISGNASLALPYWDYYTSPTIPAEFTSDTTSPLYMPRTGTDVTKALSLNPFANSITNFPRGLTNAFEPALESLPHNAVHNLIGGTMSSVAYSPKDPIFWLHHANIDRLWGAWCDAGNGRSEPPPTDPYWTGIFNYGAGVSTLNRSAVSSTASLGYQYENDTMPTSLPVVAPPAPSTLQLQAVAPTSLTTQTVSLGGAQQLSLDQRSVSVDVPLTTQDSSRVRSLLLKPAASTNGSSSIRVVLDGVRLTGLGKRGGYFYKVYINLPAQAGVSPPESAYLLGTLGAFEISEAAMMHNGVMRHDAAMHGDDAVQLVFPATEALQRIWPPNLDKLSVSFVRLDGGKPAKGTVITVKELRVEASDASAS